VTEDKHIALIEKRDKLRERLGVLQASLAAHKTKREQAVKGLEQMGVKVEMGADCLALAEAELNAVEEIITKLETDSARMAELVSRLEA